MCGFHKKCTGRKLITSFSRETLKRLGSLGTRLHKSADDEEEQNYESVDSDVICIAMTLYNSFLNFTFNGSGFMFQLSYHVWTAAGLPCISSLPLHQPL